MTATKEPEFALPQSAPMPVEVAHQKIGNIAQPDDRIRTKTHSHGAPFLLDGDFLKVTNVEPKTEEDPRGKTWVFSWERKSWVVEPGESKFVLFEALVDSLGDPRSMDDEVQRYNDGNGGQGIVMSRQFYLDALFCRYAVHNMSLDTTYDRDGTRHPGLLDKAPRVEVETLNGERVVFPVTHPAMLPLPLPNIDRRAVNTDMVKTTEKLAAENADMRDKLEALTEQMDRLVRGREGLDAET